MTLGTYKELWLHLGEKPLSQLIFGCSLSAAYVPLLGYTCHHSVSCCQTVPWPVCISCFLEALQAGYRYRTQHTFTEWAIKVSAADRKIFLLCFRLKAQAGLTCWIELIYEQFPLFLGQSRRLASLQLWNALLHMHQWMAKTWNFCCSLMVPLS